MKTTMKFFKCFMLVMAITAFTVACQKDNLEEAVLPQTAQGEQGTSGINGQDGKDGAQGQQGVSGADGKDGADGEDGATGPAGPQGEPGPAGTDGADGEDGNANVMVSPWYPVEFSDSPSQYQVFALDGATLTLEEADNSLVLCYGRTNGAYNNIYPLPHTNNTDSELYYFRLFDNFNKANYELNIMGRSLDGTGKVFNYFKEVKYFVIPANITAGKLANVDFKKMSYEEVMGHFGLAY